MLHKLKTMLLLKQELYPLLQNITLKLKAFHAYFERAANGFNVCDNTNTKQNEKVHKEQ